MKLNGLACFALGMITVISLGAFSNQIHAPASALKLTETGIVFPDGSTLTTATPTDPRTVFYLTDSAVPGAEATFNACATGFHMASIWEILDVSNLRYATNSEGDNDVFRKLDSGAGPPTAIAGWARTGQDGININLAGANCDYWNSSDGGHYGSKVELSNNWHGGDGIAPWKMTTDTCDDSVRVWCIAD